MDTRRSVSIVLPAEAPLRCKSLRQQRASNGAAIIKSYVQQSELRREQSKFHAASRALDDPSSPLTTEERTEMDSPNRPMSPLRSNQRTPLAEDPRALDALFANRRTHRLRRPSVLVSSRQASLSMPTSPDRHRDPGNNQASEDLYPVVSKPIVRKRLQMDIVSAAAHAQGANNNHHHAAYRIPAAITVKPSQRAKHNLAAKLDALAKSAMWNRRKVVLATDEKPTKTISRVGSPRHGNPHPLATHSPESHSVADIGSTGRRVQLREPSEAETELRVMTAFRQIVRLWRERRLRVEAAAVNRMSGSANGIMTGTGRNGSKLRKDLAAQSSNVVGIVSRRMIREVPALKFFDDASEDLMAVAPVGAGVSPASSGQGPDRARPRGVCYTLDPFGCRRIKMQSSSTTSTPASTVGGSHGSTTSGQKSQRAKSEDMTLEKAVSRSLHKKMARRVKYRRHAIQKLGEAFSKSRHELAMKLRTQLALQHARTEKLFAKRMALLMSDDTKLPPYQARKELHLARLRCKKAHLLEQCETLRVLGLVVRRIEDAGDVSGQEVSTSELHFLDLLRCVVEEDHVLTPIIYNSIMHHMRPQDVQSTAIMELFSLVNTEMHENYPVT